MNQIKIGKLIAELRRQSGMTQEALGEKLGVSNKTISRWENGNYMPDIEMLPLIASEFGITVDELLRGEKAKQTTATTAKADEAPEAQSPSQFTMEEQKAYLIKKWRREHIFLFVALALALILIIVILIKLRQPALIPVAAPSYMLISHIWQNNRMMAYVEDHLYGSKK